MGETAWEYRYQSPPEPETPSWNARSAILIANLRARPALLPSAALGARIAVVSEEEYKRPVLEALYAMGGEGRVTDVLAIVEQKMKGRLSIVDYDALPKSGEIRWSNRAKWARKRLVDEGMLFSRENSGHGSWKLTPQGLKAVEVTEPS